MVSYSEKKAIKIQGLGNWNCSLLTISGEVRYTKNTTSRKMNLFP
jgi:hypothetical protein